MRIHGQVIPSRFGSFARAAACVAWSIACARAPLAALGGRLDEEIDRVRRADFTLEVRGPGGAPLADTEVEVELTRHEFLFGCNIYAFDRLGDPFRNQAYKRAFRRVFNYATLPFYWRSYEPRRGAPGRARIERILEWCRAHKVVAKGHPLVWTHPAGVPEWIRGLPPEEVRELVERRVEAEVSAFRGRIALWDVVNEPVHTRAFPGFRDRLEQLASVYKIARKADPAARLVLNEYHIISGVSDGAFRDFVRDALRAGVPIDALGLQAHEPRAGEFRAEEIRAALDRFAAFGLEIHLTEVEFPSGGQAVKRRAEDGAWRETGERADEAWQARALETLYRTAFAHPAVTAITWWDLADSRSWLPGGGLLREDLSPKPAYQVLERLVRGEWRTHLRARADGRGRVRFRGFFGTYRVRAPDTLAGAEAEVVFARKGARDARVRLVPPWRVRAAGGVPAFPFGAPVRLEIEGGAQPEAVSALGPYGASSRPARTRRLEPGRWELSFEGLRPGAWRLEVAATETNAAGSLRFAVLPPDDLRLENGGGRVAVDAALSWLAPGEAEIHLELARRAGVRWIRERLSWGALEPERGGWNPGHYRSVREEAARRGLSVLDVFHDTPGWARPGPGKRYPDDLRDLYRFARRSAREFGDLVDAWAYWNEADIAVFSSETSDAYAAAFKAASLGFRDGNPAALRVLGSLAHPPGRFAGLLAENGVAPYADVWNFHTYRRPEDYASVVRAHREAADRAGMKGKPLWLTEAGVPLRTVTGALTAGQEAEQARFVPESALSALAAGVERHFLFILPYYHENDVQFGLLDRGGGPRPAYAALAALTAFLGEARDVRPLRAPPAGLAGYLWRRKGGEEGVYLQSRGQAVRVTLPGGVRPWDLFGAELHPSEGGAVAIEEARPVYLTGPSGSFRTWEGRGVGSEGESSGIQKEEAGRPEARQAPSRVVLRIRFPHQAARKTRDAWAVGNGLSGRLEVYNFSEETVNGRLRVAVAGGAAAVLEGEAVSVPPMGRLDMPLRVERKESRGEAGGEARLRVEFRRSGEGAPESLAAARLEL